MDSDDNDTHDQDALGRALLSAVMDDDADSARTIVKLREYVDGFEDEALIVAAARGRLGLVRMLIGVGADANVQRESTTALEIAVRNGFTDVVKILLDKGARMNAHEQGALREAVLADNAAMVDLLLVRGANPLFGMEDWVGMAKNTAVKDVLMSAILTQYGPDFIEVQHQNRYRELIDGMRDDPRIQNRVRVVRDLMCNPAPGYDRLSTDLLMKMIPQCVRRPQTSMVERLENAVVIRDVLHANGVQAFGVAAALFDAQGACDTLESAHMDGSLCHNKDKRRRT